MSNYSANINVKVEGLSAAEKLEKALISIESKVKALNQLSVKVKTAVTGGQTGRAESTLKTQNKLLREQTDLKLRQIRIVQQKTAGLQNQTQILNTLRNATNNVLSDQQDSVRLGQLQLSNARAMVAEETARVRQIERQNQLKAQQARQREQRFQEFASQSPAAGGGGADGGIGAAAGFALGGSLAQAKEFEQAVASVRGELANTTKEGESLKQAFTQVNTLTEKIEGNQAKQAANAKQIVDLERKVKFQTAAVAQARKRGSKDLKEAEQRLKGTKRELNALNSSQRGLGNWAENWGRELREVESSLGRINGELDKSARAQVQAAQAAARQQRNRANRGNAALAGLAFAPIPGQDIFQGAAAGKLLAGAGGAAIGATAVAVGQLAVKLGEFSREAAVARAQVDRLQIALKQVAGNQTQEALAAINRAVEDFNIPITDATQQFTQLTAAARANGNSISEVENLFRGLSSAVKATGGSTEDLSGALRAAVQVMSKGTVQAEELTGQIGDRLPGAFALFARATNRSAEELQDALRKGEVSANEFVREFATLLRNEYEPAAQRIADSPAEAGARLEKALADLRIATGDELGRIGASFQDFAAEAVNALKDVWSWMERTGQTIEGRNLEGYIKGLNFALDGLRNVQQTLLRTDLTNQQQETALANLKIWQKSVENFQAKIDALKMGPPVPPAATDPPKEDKTEDPTAKREADYLKDLVLRTKLVKEAYEYERLIAEARQKGNSRLAAELEGLKQMTLIYERAKAGAAATEGGAGSAAGREIMKAAEVEIERIALQVAERSLQLEKEKTEAQKVISQQLTEQIAKYRDVFAAQEQAVVQEQELARLIAEGINPALAERLIELQSIAAEQTEILNADIAIAEAEKIKAKAAGLWTDELEKQLKLLKAQAGAISDQYRQAADLARDRDRVANSPRTRLAEEITEAKDGLATLQDPINILTAAATELGLAFSEAFKGVVTGSMSAQEAFGNMTKRMGEFFIDMAMDMVAQYVKLIAMQAIYRALGGPPLAASPVGSQGNPFGNVLGGSTPGGPAAGGGRIPLAGLATGGRALGGGSYIVGERGPEIFTPDSPGTVSSNRAFDAARDSMSMESDGAQQNAAAERDARLDDAAQGFYETASKPLELETVVINQVEYATVEQVRRSMEASVKTARARTMDDLRNFPAKRGRVGMR